MVLLSVHSIQGRREYMEDRYAYIQKGDVIVAMICDGHGGYSVAHETSRNLPQRLFRAITNVNGSNLTHAKALRQEIMAWGEKIFSSSKRSGSTLTGVVAKGDTVYIFNVGDSRTCLHLVPYSTVYFLKPHFGNKGYIPSVNVDHLQTNFFCTPDHDPESSIEIERIKLAGGKFVNKRLNGILSVTRAIGDNDIGPGMSYVPDIFWFKRSSVDGPVLMYSDGVYEMQRYQKKKEFSDHFLYHLANKFNPEVLIQYAFVNGSEDNMTAMLLDVTK